MTLGPMSTRLGKVLLSHRTTPQGMTGISPAELLLKRSPRTHLDIICPNTPERVEERQWQHKRNHDTRSKLRSLKLGDAVLVKNFGSGSHWLLGKIIQGSGPVSFRVLLEDGRQQKWHMDHLLLRFLDEETEDDSLVSSSDTEESEFPVPESSTVTQHHLTVVDLLQLVRRQVQPRTTQVPNSNIVIQHAQVTRALRTWNLTVTV